MHEHLEPTGTFLGHVLAGVFLTGWGLWWFRSVLRDLRGEAPSRGALTVRGGLWPARAVYSARETWLKLALPVGAALGDLWWAGWRMTDTSVMNYQHATAYLGFFFAGLADLVVRRGRAPAQVAQLALALAFAGAAWQFLAHGNHGPVSDAVHRIVIALFLLEAGVVLAELRFPHPALALARAYGLVLHGAWFLQVAWILYRSGWDQGSAYNVMRVNLFFSWHVFGVLILLWLLHALQPRRVPPGMAQPAPAARALARVPTTRA